MTPNKNRVGIVFLGWALIVSTLCNFFFGYRMMKDCSLIVFLYDMFGYIAIFPRGPHSFFCFLFQKMSFLTSTNLLLWLVFIWELLIIIAGAGILKLNNLSRLLLITLCTIQIATYTFFRLYLIAAFQVNRSFGSFLYALPDIILTLIFPAAYFFYLTRSEVKILFRK